MAVQEGLLLFPLKIKYHCSGNIKNGSWHRSGEWVFTVSSGVHVFSKTLFAITYLEKFVHLWASESC